ncbi:hypothetical protein [Stutzerimonas azotifigens]|uniref:hypothetical protein n=1 Tax=Stutzerimonas azotifigens TaxID=291995 RepID=UPI001268AFFA|nr:hypothetical protein [Stutzerimonas azotifigens]
MNAAVDNHPAYAQALYRKHTVSPPESDRLILVCRPSHVWAERGYPQKRGCIGINIKTGFKEFFLSFVYFCLPRQGAAKGATGHFLARTLLKER